MLLFLNPLAILQCRSHADRMAPAIAKMQMNARRVNP
jgi:hypothetical protein